MNKVHAQREIRQYFVQNPIQIQAAENYKREQRKYDFEDDDDENLLITDKDGMLLDKHDQFYWTTKSLLVLFQIMGVMPIMRVPPKREAKYRTTYEWISTAAFWAYLIWCAECVIIFYVGKARLDNFMSTERKFDDVIYIVIFMSILLPHFFLPIGAWRHGDQVAVFKNMWTHYQLKYLRVTGKPLMFPTLYVLTWALCIGSWSVSVGIMLIQYYFQSDFEFWHLCAYYHILAMFNSFCSLWFVNCTAFGVASQGLSESLEKTLETENPSAKLAEHRKLWVDLSLQMQQLGRAYSNMYGILCLLIFFTTIVSLYGSFSEVLERGFGKKVIGLLILSVYCMTLLFIICNEAYHAWRKVGLNFQQLLFHVDLSVLDRSSQREIEMFLTAIDKNPPIMNLDGYTNINRELITTNISFLATYLVVLMQFKITLLRQNATDAKRTPLVHPLNTTVLPE